MPGRGSDVTSGDDRLRLLLDQMRDTVFRVRLRPEVRVEYVSPSLEALIGRGAEDWYADPDLPLGLVHPDDRHVIEATLRGEESARDVARFLRPDGSVTWVEAERRVLRDAEGRPEAVEGVARDITSRVEAEE